MTSLPGSARETARPDGDDLAAAQQILQERLEAAAPRAGESDNDGTAGPAKRPGPDDLVGLFRHLEASGRFSRDTGFGRIFHPGSVSFRENQPTDSLHVVVHDDHIAAHVDRVSPLGLRTEGGPRYSLRQAAAHNVTGAVQDLVRLLQGRKGDHRSELDCEWVWDSSKSQPEVGDLLDPTTASWSVHLEVRVSGTLDEGRLRAAIAAVIGPRPPDRDAVHVFECPTDAALGKVRTELQNVPVAITHWPPFTVVLARHAQGDVLMLNLNHAAADGVGALQVVRAIASAYADGAGAGAGKPLEFLATLDLPVRPASSPVSRVMGTYRALVERARDQLARPAQFAPDHGGEGAGSGFHLVRLSVEETRRVLDVEPPTTAKGYLLATLHLAIGDWNLQHGAPGRRIGVLVPVNLRPPGWDDHPVGNFSVTARVSTSRRHRSGRPAALKEVNAQTRRNKRARTGTALLAGLERAGLLPLWAKQSLVVLQPLTRNLGVDTATMVDLGWLESPPSFGPGCDVVEAWFSAPARSPRNLCLGAVTVDGRLHLTFRYPHSLFSADAVRRFAQCYLAQLGWAGDGTVG